jgi:hypothetical protein
VTRSTLPATRSTSEAPRAAAGVRLAAALVLAASAACNTKTATNPIQNLAQSSSVAVFRGVTLGHKTPDVKSALPLANLYAPHLAIANAQNDDLSIADAQTDILVEPTLPLHGLVYPVAYWPTLVASADLGDGKPDVLVAVSGGDSKLKLIRTWLTDGAITAEVDFAQVTVLSPTIVAVLGLPPDPAVPGTARVVAALAGGQLAVVTFQRSTGSAGTEILVSTANPPVVSAPLGFLPMSLATRGDGSPGALQPGDPATIYAATSDPIPQGGNVFGVARIDVGTTTVAPTFAVTALNAVAPTRLVASTFLAEANPGSTALDPSDFTTTTGPNPVVERVYAVLDESGCGFYAPIACGVVALTLDPAEASPGTSLLPDPSDDHAPFKAPIQLGFATGLAVSGPPAMTPDDLNPDPLYAVTIMRMVTDVTTRGTTAAGGATSTDGSLNFIDLGHWEIPSHVWIHATVRAVVSPVTPAASDQWLTLVNVNPVTLTTTVVSHLDATGLTTSVQVTAGYTPNDRWIVTHEGILPQLTSRRAEAGWDPSEATSLWLALQVTDPAGGPASEVVNLFDPVVGVSVGDIVVFDASVVGTCSNFEATVTALDPPDPARFPGGAVRIDDRATTDPVATAQWAQCMDQLRAEAILDAATPVRALRATIRAGGYVLVRGTGQAAIPVGRPQLGVPFSVRWQDETALVAACLLPPAHPWLAAGAGACTVGSACRTACEALIQARLSRRLSYLTEPDGSGNALASGPAMQFTLALETAATPERDLTLILDTIDGRSPFRVFPPNATTTGAGQVISWDRSPYVSAAGIRFFAPYVPGIVVDATPSLTAGDLNAIR